ncbi:MAG: pyridoxamine 5'-phosphate oxidase family protein, partial [Pseudobutyrivibrio sp.]|nr:pyridoxamine 5'-phosphate oxidase family protein [Pseudobutyrivibrio sp.]
MRRRDREITDQNKIQDILNTCSYLHLGLSDDGMPYVVPLNYGLVKDEIDGHYIIYLHGAHEGRKLDIIKKNPNCSFTMERNVAPFEGRMACQHGMVYESIMGVGKVSIVNDP